MPKRVHKYFEQRAQEWNITGFLNECELESFRQIIEYYLSSLEAIIMTETGPRHEKAQILFDKYKKATVNYETNNGTVIGGTSVSELKREFEEDGFEHKIEANQIKQTRTNRQSTPEDQIRPSFVMREKWIRLQGQIRREKIKPQTVSITKDEMEFLDDDYYFIDYEEVSNCYFTDHEEVRNLNSKNALIRNTLLEILFQYRSKDLESGKTIMNSNFLNRIMDITDADVKQSVWSKLDEEQQL
ncbi:6860_t:CDS:2 [Cetraspora pellucida]|uniref:6860_t:CDS:1 n=1 Tax=Cetraspora pellucida TaxID=1433469 RepID=A0A9N9B3L1_9GLOM|nr:6860_t:CDS:2 [Cetraspora pellucida]